MLLIVVKLQSLCQTVCHCVVLLGPLWFNGGKEYLNDNSTNIWVIEQEFDCYLASVDNQECEIATTLRIQKAFEGIVSVATEKFEGIEPGN